MFSLALIFVMTSSGQSPAGQVARSPHSVVEAKFDAVNRHSIEDVAAFYSTDAIISASDFCAPRHGRSDVKRTYKRIFEAIPDVIADVQEYVVQGDRVAVRFVVRSRLPGRSFDLTIMNFFTVRDGLIVSDEGVFDNGGRPCTP
ncbi:MAG: nuclear transport factor 2 family protein [Sphingosinicella sp.]|nr:nuclear transport factor 2 family protein [Sphingosinicella sp.]